MYKKGKLPLERQRRLEALPEWVWEPFEAKWEDGYKALEVYAARENDCLVPQKYKTDDGFPLGVWILHQRTESKKGNLSFERQKRLDALPGWVWSAKN